MGDFVARDQTFFGRRLRQPDPNIPETALGLTARAALSRDIRKIERNVTRVTSCPWCRALSCRRVASGRVSWMEIWPSASL